MTVESTAFRNAVFLFSFALLLLKTSHLINKLNTVMIKKTKTNNIFMFVVFCFQIRLQIMSKKRRRRPLLGAATLTMCRLCCSSFLSPKNNLDAF